MGKAKASRVLGVWMVCVFLVAMYGVLLNVPLVRGSGTIYIRADGSIDPPTAPIQREGDLYTFTGDIAEPIVVQRDNIVINGAGYIVQGAGSGRGIDLSYRSNVTIRNLRISRFEEGILVNSTGRIIIEKNEVFDNSESGIMIEGRSNVLIKENIIKQNKNGVATDAVDTHSGIVVRNNTIVSNQEKGIYIYSYNSGYGSYGQPYKSYIYNVTVSFNNVSSNGGDGILLHSYVYTTGYGFTYSYLYDILFSSNNVSSNGGNGINLYSRSSSTCERGEAYIYNIIISDSTISSNGGNGIQLHSYASVGWLSSSGYGYGYISNITVSKSSVSLNGEYGIYLSGQGTRATDIAYSAGYGSTYDVNVSFCTLSFNGKGGIYLYSYGYGSVSGLYSSANGFGYIYNVVFSFNNVSFNDGDGIHLYSYGYADGSTYGGDGYGYIYDATFSSNTVSSNNGTGIHLYGCGFGLGGWGTSHIYDIAVSSNVVSSNGEDGIYLHSYGARIDYESYYDSLIYRVNVSSNTVSSNKGNGVHTKAVHSYTPFDLEMLDSTIVANYYKGIWIEGGINANLTRNSLSYNLYGVFYAQGTKNLAQYNDIYYNSFGMSVTDGATVNAELNYWGNASGPYHESLNMNGTGNSVNGNGADLDFIPFLTGPVGQIVERPVVRAHITVSIDPAAVLVGQNVTTNGAITPAKIGVNVTISYRPSLGMWATLAIVQTNSNSSYTYTWKTTDPGTYEVKALWSGDESVLPGESETKDITVSGYITILPDGSVAPSHAPIQRDENSYTLISDIFCGIVVKRSNIAIDGFGYMLQGPYGEYGFSLSGISNVTIKRTDIRGFSSGILLESSNNNTISENNITNNNYGVSITGSFNNTITQNNIANNDLGISLAAASNNNIVRNNITNNNYYGIYLGDSSNNNISANQIYNNYEYGVFLVSSSGNIVSANDVTNTSYGVYLIVSSNNIFYHNNFINNTQQVRFYESGYANVWDDGYPSGGNYWSDHTGVDLYSGPYQNITGSDGIGDMPHVIDAYNRDRYPLMNPYGKVPEDLTPPTTIHDYDGFWHTTDFTITLTATDDMSGVAETYYRINDGPTKTVSANGQPLITAEGINSKLEFWSVDNADNEESHHILTEIKLDKTYPTIETFSYTPDDDVPPDQAVKVSVNVTDSVSGVKDVTLSFTINDGATWTGLQMTYNSSTHLYEASIPAQSAGTLVKCKITACDNAQHEAVNDNAGQYYVYTVVPELPSTLILPLLMALTTLTLILTRSRIYSRRRSSTTRSQTR